MYYVAQKVWYMARQNSLKGRTNMAKIKTILVVEDKEDERESALEAIKLAFGVEPTDKVSRFDPMKGRELFAFPDKKFQVYFAGTLRIAQLRLSWMKEGGTFKEVVDMGVLTDLMFPANEAVNEEPNGIGVILDCFKEALPVVVCSDTDHHELNWAKDLWPFLARQHPKGEIPVILDRKDWGRAVGELIRIMSWG